MTFRSAVTGMADGDAVKIPTMNGYVKRVDVTKTASDTWDSKYNIVFQERSDSDNDGHTTYTFTFTVTGDDTVVTTSDSLVVDPALLLALLSNDWVSGTAAEFEATRSGTGNRW